MPAEGHIGHCYLKGRAGDSANVILFDVGHNFCRIFLAEGSLVPHPDRTHSGRQ